jgi:CRISPR-associated protein Csx17
LGNYLKALGVFRLVAEQADPTARAWWEGGVLRLQSRLKLETDLHSWFRDEYAPSAQPSPWSVNSGWWPPKGDEGTTKQKGDKRGGPFQALRKLIESDLPRLANFRRADQDLRRLLGEPDSRPIEHETQLGTGSRALLNDIETEAKKQRARTELLRRLRNTCGASAVRWFDAVAVIGTSDDRPEYFPILGDGALEGVNSFAGNLYKFISEHLPVKAPEEFWESPPGHLSSWRLMASLFGTVAKEQQQKDAAGGLYFPGLMEAPNIGQGFVAEPKKRANPWDFILAMEGMLSWSVAALRRLEAGGRAEPSFPFFCDSGFGGNAALGASEMARGANAKTRGELWLPIWHSPTNYAEFERLIVEGRVTVGQRTATGATDFALGVASLGSERGIAAFARTGLLQRSGSGDNITTLAVPLGTWTPHNLPNAGLASEMSRFQSRVARVLVLHNHQPRRLVLAREHLEEALMAFAAQVEEAPGSLLEVLLAASRLERELTLTAGEVKYPVGEKFEKKRIDPVQPLSNWRKVVSASNDSGALFDPRNPREYRLALALASLLPWGEDRSRDRAWIVGPLRENLLPLTLRALGWTWEETSRAAVWSRAKTFTANLAAALHRRLVDSQHGSGCGLPLWGFRGALLADVLALWRGSVDETRLGDLMHAFALVDFGRTSDERVADWQAEQDPTPDLAPSGVWFLGEDARLSMPPSLGVVPTDEVKAAFALPRAYALLKLCFLGGRLPARPVAKSAAYRSGVEPYPNSPSRILNLLLSGRVADAISMAAQQLRAKGYPPILLDADLRRQGFDLSAEEGWRLAGLLLIPVRHAGLLASITIKPRN